eukprot:IDg11612t1
MTVLASRKEYCIRGEVHELSNRNRGVPWPRQEGSVSSASQRARPRCPYYASAELYKQAQIIFCPYNYIVDKNVREAKGIDIKGDILVFDEAHNIEDFSRDSASFSVDVLELQQVVDELREVIAGRQLGSPNSDLALAAVSIIELIASLLSLVETILAGQLEQSFDYEYSLHEGQLLSDILEDHGVTKASVDECDKAVALIREQYNNEDKNDLDENKQGSGADVGAGAVADGGSAVMSQSMLTQSPFGFGYTMQEGQTQN